MWLATHVGPLASVLRLPLLCMGGGAFAGIGIATIDERQHPLEAIIKMPMCGVIGAGYGALFAIGGPLCVITAPVRRVFTGKWFWGA